MKYSEIPLPFRRKNGRWNIDLEFIISIYDCFLREPDLKKVAKAIQANPSVLSTLLSKHPELQQAKRMADHNRTKSRMAGWILTRLSPATRATWEALTSVSTLEEIDAIFANKPTRMRQELFCHAILHTGYDISKARSIVGISYKDMMGWRNDPEFEQMLEEIQATKSEFWEKKLHELGEDGNPGVIMFVNRTLNRHKGYGEAVIQIGPVGGDQVDIESLDLDLETMKKVLAAMEKQKAEREAEREAGYVKQLPSAKR